MGAEHQQQNSWLHDSKCCLVQKVPPCWDLEWGWWRGVLCSCAGQPSTSPPPRSHTITTHRPKGTAICSIRPLIIHRR